MDKKTRELLHPRMKGNWMTIRGNTIKIADKVKFKKGEKFEQFEKRLKSMKLYSEDFLIEALYDYMCYSEQLCNVVTNLNNTLDYADRDKYEQERELDEMEQKVERWKAMYTGQCEANRILIQKLEN